MAYNYAYADPQTAFRELFKSVSNDPDTRAKIDADSLLMDYLSHLSTTNYNNVQGLERLKMTKISETIGDIKDRDRQINAIADQILDNIPKLNAADLSGNRTTVQKQEVFAKILVSAMRAGLTNSALFTLDTLGTPYTGIPSLMKAAFSTCTIWATRRATLGNRLTKCVRIFGCIICVCWPQWLRHSKSRPKAMVPCLITPSSPIRPKTVKLTTATASNSPL